jgi:AhpD family alkylhydroperoxidase
MDMKLRELISLGASVSAHCFPCFDYHLEQARKFGICEEDIKEAIRSGFMVMNGAGDKVWEKIRDTMPEFSIAKNESCSNGSRSHKIHRNSIVRF